ncbi:site-specific integrase [Kineothrix alysoides]|uniref:site-specific integrase n=1 Tax=Kineothrix alysoides TaxID=1469948 RepID=UPI0012FEE7F5|nr:site-specific integrase [Kineothrix alysoides]
MSIYDITQEIIQIAINKEACSHSPKTVRNMHGLLSAVPNVYRPEFHLNTSLPQKVKPKFYIPTDDDVKILLQHVNDEEMMIAILLAAFGPMRRSGICALESTDIKDKIIHVENALVMDENKKWVTKKTKSFAGDRFIPLPDFILEKIKGKKGRIIQINPSQVSDRFIDIQRASGLPHFRFHDLRHYCASIQHAMGIPDAYIMQRGGWGSDAVLKQVYRHALSDQEIKMNNIANTHFSGIMQHDMQHKK